MVKPALPYLDIIADAASLAPDHPLACYQVSGEYAMVVAGARAGVYDLRTMAFETTESMVRAGEWSLRFRSRALVPSPRVAIHSEFLCLVVLPPIPSLPLTRHPTDQPTRLILHPSGCTLILSYFTPQFLDWLDE